MKDVMDQIAGLLAKNHVDATRESDDDWECIMTDTFYINELHSSGLLSPSIGIICEQDGCHISLRGDDIDDVDVVVDEEERPRLYIATKAGNYFEFALTKEDEYERAE